MSANTNHTSSRRAAASNGRIITIVRRKTSAPDKRRGLRIFSYVVLAFALAFLVFVLAVRFIVLPNINSFRGTIENQLSAAIGLPVSIGTIDADWEEIRPLLKLHNVKIDDRQGNAALSFSEVEALVSWQGIFSWKLHTHRLEIVKPQLSIRRLTDKKLQVAGIILSDDGENGAFGRWLMDQGSVRIREAVVTWTDEWRQAPPLVLEEVNFNLNNWGTKHLFSVNARPPADLASKIDFHGDLIGEDLSHPASWSGKINVSLEYADLVGWRPWFDYTENLTSGRGSLKLTAEIGNTSIGNASINFSLNDVLLKLQDDLPEIGLEYLSGTLRLSQMAIDAANGEIKGEKITWIPKDGPGLDPINFSLHWNRDSNGKILGEIDIDTLDIGAIADLVERFPLETTTRTLLTSHQPRGRLHKLNAKFTRDNGKLDTFSFKTDFLRLELTAYDRFPGFSGISGSISADEKSGTIELDSQKTSFILPNVFQEPHLDFDTIKADIGWTLQDDRIDVELRHLAFANPDAAGEFQGSYYNTGTGPGNIDISGNLSRAEANRIWRYLPNTVNPDARKWVKNSIRSGIAAQTQFAIQGDLANFPFGDNKNGHFLVTTQARQMDLDYAPAWPGIKKLDADLRFEGNGMKIQGLGGKILNTNIKSVSATIPDFNHSNEWLHLQGSIDGATSEFLRFIEASPVGGKINHFTRDMTAEGSGRLDLQLDMPLRKSIDTAIKGNYTINNNRLALDADSPPLTSLKGTVSFTENDVTAQNLQGVLYGFPLKLSFKNQKSDVVVSANGRASIEQIATTFPSPLWSHFSGNTDWQANIDMTRKGMLLTVRSDLKGIASDLPPPLTKIADTTLPLVLTQNLPGKTAESGANTPEQVFTIELGELIHSQMVRRGGNIERGFVAIGQKTSQGMPEKGIQLWLALPQLNLDTWKALLDRTESKSGGAPLPALTRINLAVDNLELYSRQIHQVKLQADRLSDGWKIGLDTKEISGTVNWENSGQGSLHLRLSRLVLPDNDNDNDSSAVPASATFKSLPALDIVADSFTIGKRSLGRLEVQAVNRGTLWQIDRLSMAHPSGRIEATGQWHTPDAQNPASEESSVAVKVAAKDIGGYLTELGFPGAVQNGTANIAGRLRWPGKPTDFQSSVLSGNFEIQALHGQFVKIDPGMGKLLGLLSLQSLSRRISFDFRDLFSDGFAFDSINGNVAIDKGTMNSDDLTIVGPAARVRIQGEVDLKNEGQTLGIIVEPDLGGTVAVGTMVVNPVTGIAAMIALKILKDPLDKMFANAYAVTGSWTDPKVEKLARFEPLPTAAQSTDAAKNSAEKNVEPVKNYNPYLQ